MIGWRRKNSDVRGALTSHLQNVASDAPIRSVLGSSDIEARIAQFDWADAVAVRQRVGYRRFRLLSLWATMTGAIAGALFLLPIERWIDGWPRSAIQLLQALALILALIATIWVSTRQAASQWLQSRALAERMRADVFRAIVRIGLDSPRLLAPAFACFRDAHLDWQMAFYASSGDRYRRSAGNTAPYRLAGYLLLAVAVLFGLVGVANLAAKFQLQLPGLNTAMQWLTLEHPERWQLGLGAMASSILAFSSARSFMDLDDRNASFYGMAAKELRRVRAADLQHVEVAAANGNVADVLGFCEKVQTILDAEHLAWVLARPPEEPASSPTQKA